VVRSVLRRDLDSIRRVRPRPHIDAADAHLARRLAGGKRVSSGGVPEHARNCVGEPRVSLRRTVGRTVIEREAGLRLASADAGYCDGPRPEPDRFGLLWRLRVRRRGVARLRLTL
jgi:hypothetical protein